MEAEFLKTLIFSFKIWIEAISGEDLEGFLALHRPVRK